MGRKEFLGREKFAEKARGAAWFKALFTDAKWELGDQLVLGDFDWRAWGFTRKPSSYFMAGVDEARILWELSR